MASAPALAACSANFTALSVVGAPTCMMLFDSSSVLVRGDFCNSHVFFI